MSEANGIINRIVKSIAYREQVEPTALDPPLQEAIDTDALARIAETDALRRLEFTYLDYEVVVDGDGRVHVGAAVEQ